MPPVASSTSAEPSSSASTSSRPIQQVAKSATEPPKHTSFSSIGISPMLIRSLAALQIKIPTPIQSLTIPSVLEGRDLVGGAQTGSGKTLCFALPILNKLIKDMVGGFAVVLTPTRELGVQLHEQFVAVGEGARMGLRCALVLGGMDMMKQASELANLRPHVIVATPGRLVDHLRSGGGEEWGLRRCRFLVLDEADRLLTPTFKPELDYLHSVLPSAKTLQTLLFTATLTEEVVELANAKRPEGKPEPMVCKIEMDTKTPATLEQRYVFVPSHIREPYLFHVMRHPPIAPSSERVRKMRAKRMADLERKAENERKKGKRPRVQQSDDEEEDATLTLPSTIIFAARCKTAATLSGMLSELGIPNVSLHSHLKQSERSSNLQSFRAQRVPVLIATDVGSRGLDIPDVELVVNWDLPSAWQDYVHRVGRTARNGKRGFAISFITERDIDVVHSIEDKIGTKLTQLEGLEDEDAILEKLGLVSTAKRVATMALHDGQFGERQQRNREKKEVRAKAEKRAKRAAARSET
ncbi:DNA/RNA helicase, DEAD/DEAH box type, N-terminal [Kalmanozyma brasiliensis GHG001]|uniref:ATP-dependent RNA helicase n=1 Tax=Kalmanozyma brasiliensis (strain GHG001) TaxID=1365824 RepID=V5ELX8_KALBG|nr:DNA/RNA helicase, DEAD/DEAH box type, N-terminal [Kalmanozyma brasiliensis GHG001]EST06090.1 DNA/RNA helicase, DEAD/DEAH box type, N-terminal [Kalmanozyma brasiliensis GHG001]